MEIGGLEPGRVAAAAAVVAAFAFPGVRAVAFWDRDARRYSSPGRIALGFLASFGAFSGFAGPMLVAHQPTSVAIWASLLAWGSALLGVEAWRARGAPPAASEGLGEPPAIDLPPARWSAAVGALTVASLAAAWALAAEWMPRRFALAACAALFLANGWVWLRARRLAQPAPPTAPLRALHGVAAGAAVALGVAAAVATTIWVREDTDDVLYLSSALVLADSQAMGAAHPTHRGEALPPNDFYAWSAFELWGALVSRASGVHTLALFRTLFAPLVFVLSVFACYELFRRILPRGSVAVAMLVTLSYSTFGLSSHWTANNLLLPRPAQGKTWLVHLAVPALVRIAYEFARRPSAGSFALVFLVCLAGLGYAPSGVFLVPATLGAALLTYAALWPGRDSIVRGMIGSAALAPLVAFGLWVGLRSDAKIVEAFADRTQPGTWHDEFFFTHLDFARGSGALEIFPLVALPLAALFIRKREQLFYPAAFTLVLFATVVNPVVYPVLGGAFTGWEGYKRLFWLVPYPLLMGVLAAGLLQAATETRWPRAAGAAVLAGFLFAMPLTGGALVFGANNPSGGRGSGPPPYRAENALKMPEDLRRLGIALLERPHGPGALILCSERTGSHLAPLVPAFDFVFTRHYITRVALKAADRHRDAEERERLGSAFLAGEVPAAEAAALLARQPVRYAVLDGPSPQVEEALGAAGFAPHDQFGDYRLWIRGDGREARSGDGPKRVGR
jgi:hypothetical protein